MSAMFRSFSVFNYRVWFIGALVSNIGAWMQATAISWVVLTELTDNDAAAMGVTMALQFGPPLLLVGVTGWVADRFDRRKLLMVTQSALLLLGLAIGVLLFAGRHDAADHVRLRARRSASSPRSTTRRGRRSSPTSSARENASNAVALNAASFNGARMIGPAVAGIVIVAVGTGWVFLVNAVTFLGDARRARADPHRRARPARQGHGAGAPRRRLPLRRASAPTSS